MTIRRRKMLLIGVVAAVAVGAILWYWLSYPRYEVVYLGSLGGSDGIAFAINNAGQVVGWCCVNKQRDYHAFIWDAEDGMRDLGTLGGKASSASGINDHGQVVGWSEIADGSRRAFIWDSMGGMTELGTLGGGKSKATAINNKGQVVGSSETPEGESHAFIWNAETRFTDIGALGGNRSWAVEINERGEVVGSSSLASGTIHAFYWSKATGMIDLGAGTGPRSYGFSINNAGQVVGNVVLARTDNSYGFIWEKDSGLRKLNLSDGRVHAHKINDSGQIIGALSTHKFLFVPARYYNFLRTKSGRRINLDRFSSSKFEQIEARDINNDGWITGAIRNTEDKTHKAILLKPKGSLR